MAKLDARKFQTELINSLTDEDPIVRWYVSGLLRDFGDTRAVPALLRLVGDPDPGVRVIAVHALGRIGNQACTPVLQMALTHDIVEDAQGRTVRKAAQEAIDEIQRQKN